MLLPLLLLLPALEADRKVVHEVIRAAARPCGEPEQHALVLLPVAEQIVAQARLQSNVEGAHRLEGDRGAAAVDPIRLLVRSRRADRRSARERDAPSAA